jgi:FAD binding domain-containing protein
MVQLDAYRVLVREIHEPMRPTNPNWAALQRAIDGVVVLPTSPDYDRLRRLDNSRFDDVRPAAIVRCASADDVVTTVELARRHRLPLVPRSDRHSLARRSSTQAVVIDVTPKLEWPLEIRGDTVHGPNAPSAGPPPYSVFRLIPSLVLGLPGPLGMERFDPSDLPRPTRWEFQR